MLKFLLSHGYNGTDRQLCWLIDRLDRFGVKEVDAADTKVGLTPAKIH